jgi:hypothetical protein
VIYQREIGRRLTHGRSSGRLSGDVLEQTQTSGGNRIALDAPVADDSQILDM